MKDNELWFQKKTNANVLFEIIRFEMWKTYAESYSHYFPI